MATAIVVADTEYHNVHNNHFRFLEYKPNHVTKHLRGMIKPLMVLSGSNPFHHHHSYSINTARECETERAIVRAISGAAGYQIFDDPSEFIVVLYDDDDANLATITLCGNGDFAHKATVRLDTALTENLIAALKEYTKKRVKKQKARIQTTIRQQTAAKLRRGFNVKKKYKKMLDNMDPVFVTKWSELLTLEEEICDTIEDYLIVENATKEEVDEATRDEDTAERHLEHCLQFFTDHLTDKAA